MSKAKIFISVLAVIFGIFLFIFGEYDDSPGGQLLGLVIGGVGVWGLFGGIKKK